MLHTDKNHKSQLVKMLHENETELIINKGDLICTDSQSKKCFFFVKEGYLCNFHIYIDGKECIIGLLSEGDVVGLENLFRDSTSNVFYRALTKVKVIPISSEKLEKVIEQDPALSLALLKYFSESHHDMIETLEQISYGTVENRLLFLFKKFIDLRLENSQWYPIPVSLTHKDIAGMIGSTRETVTLEINKLLKKGVIKRLKNIMWLHLEKNS